MQWARAPQSLSESAERPTESLCEPELPPESLLPEGQPELPCEPALLPLEAELLESLCEPALLPQEPRGWRCAQGSPVPKLLRTKSQQPDR